MSEEDTSQPLEALKEWLMGWLFFFGAMLKWLLGWGLYTAIFMVVMGSAAWLIQFHMATALIGYAITALFMGGVVKMFGRVGNPTVGVRAKPDFLESRKGFWRNATSIVADILSGDWPFGKRTRVAQERTDAPPASNKPYRNPPHVPSIPPPRTQPLQRPEDPKVQAWVASSMSAAAALRQSPPLPPPTCPECRKSLVLKVNKSDPERQPVDRLFWACKTHWRRAKALRPAERQLAKEHLHQDH